MRSRLGSVLLILAVLALSACSDPLAARNRSIEILDRVNAPLSTLREGMSYEEVVDVLKERQALIEREPELREMKWTWTAPRHEFTIELEGKPALAVRPSSGGTSSTLLLFVDGRLLRAIDARGVGKQAHEEASKTEPPDHLMLARERARLALQAPSIEAADLPARLTEDERGSVQQYLRGGDFPSLVVVALAPIAMVGQTEMNIRKAEYATVAEKYNATDIALGSGAALLRERWGDPQRTMQRDEGTETITFASPAADGYVIEVAVDVTDGRVRALFTYRRFAERNRD